MTASSLHERIEWIPAHARNYYEGVDEWLATVIHFTAAGSYAGTARWFQYPEADSAHFIIGRAGQVVQSVSLRDRAHHAGMSRMMVGDEVRQYVNAFGIGIELANIGPLVKWEGNFYWKLGRQWRRYKGKLQPVYMELGWVDSEKTERGYWEPYPTAQMDALEWLLDLLAKEGHEKAARNLVGHDEISGPHVRSEKYKIDPGPAFPWARFGRAEGRRTIAHELVAA